MNYPPVDQNNPLLLASSSPRRRQLLAQIGLPFIVKPSHIEEDESNNDPARHTLLLAEEKAKTVIPDSGMQWVLGADTVVVIDREVLGKPVNTTEAVSMLTRLSGRKHDVITGFCILDASGRVASSEAVSTQVVFKDLEPREIEAYVATGEPFGKAGSYAVQGIGAFMVKGIHGSYTNVVGLPVCAVIAALKRIGALGRFPFTR
jgi:septum formation protein